ncbi:uncharacterized protein [Miscanthus floridulus]|uniref:uncharacterized protein n=1 Tax=Miscanthus floridulus TaxID=154761 RepID=UPI003458074F
MDSVASNTTTPCGNRINRALQQNLRLLHRAGAEFSVLGARGYVYTVTLSTTPACTCPDPVVPCKHILFVQLRVLGLSLDEACDWRQVARLVGTPTYPDQFAGARARERLHQSWSRRPLDSAACPVCLEEMVPAPASESSSRTAASQAILTCRTCRNAVHAECFARWERRFSGRAATCVVCRSQWRQPNREQEQEQYMNLADGAACPVCLEEIVPAPASESSSGTAASQAILTCRTCRNAVHTECFARWERSFSGRAVTCVVCRSQWRQPNREQEHEQYMNLAAYMNDDGDVTMHSADGGPSAG